MSVLQSLNRLHDRLASNDKAPSFGFSREKISFAIDLSLDGKPVDIQDWRDTSGKTPEPRRVVVPRPVKRTGQPAPNFLWDKTAFAFGVKRDADTKQPVRDERTWREHAAFKDFHNRLLALVADDAIQAFVRFVNDWWPEEYENLRHAQDMLDTNVAFRLDGEHEFLHERSSAREVWLAHLADEEGAAGLCLVTGERAPIARLRASIKGVVGAESSGASVVSFEKDAFKSLGKERGANAPVSERAAFAYTTSLNALLERNSRQCIRIGDTTTVFWAEAAGNETDALAAAEDLFSRLVNPPIPTDEQEAVKIADALNSVAKGRPLVDIARDVDENTRFFVLGLAPNAARLSVRFWHEDSIGALIRRIGEHFNDMRFEPSPWRAAWRLLLETAVQCKSENISPILGGALMRSILTGRPYPNTLMSAIIIRIRADGQVRGLRAAIIKACIVRKMRIGSRLPKENYLVSLDTNSDCVAYNLGRLFAAFTYAEKSFAERNATIRDKYMGAASTAPRRTFPILMRGYEHNRSGLAKAQGRKPVAGVRADQAVTAIVDRLDGGEAIPTTLSLEDQGKFFIGYYHQERNFYAKSEHGADQGQHEEEQP